MSQRETFIRFVLELERSRVPYLWGGKRVSGIDCSGVVTLGLYLVGAPDVRATANTDVLWTGLAPIEAREVRPGDLAFYGGSGPDDVEHVMVVLDGGRVVGASGGGRTTTTLEEARRIDARMKRFSKPTYRGDLRGYRRLPLPLES